VTIRSRTAASSTALPHQNLPDELPPDATRVATGVAIVLVAQLMLVLDATVVNVALPRIDADLGFGPASLSWVLNAYALAFGGLLLLGGRLGDVRGRRRLFLVGLGVFTLASLLGGLAQSPTQLVLARAAQGVGAAMAAPSVLALLTTNAPDVAARNRALALFGAVSSSGASIGLVLGGLLTDVASWRWTLFINVPIGLAVLLLTPRFVNETPRREGRFDVVGALTSTVAAVSVVWALVGAPEHGWLSARTLGMLLVGALSLALLVRTERRHPHPLIRPSLLTDRRRIAALVVMGFVIAGQLSMFFLTVQYTQRALGMGPLATGFAFLPFSIGIFTMSRFTPTLLGRFGAARLIPVGAALLLTGFVLLSRVSETSTYAANVLPSMILSGIGGALVFMPVTATVLSGVEHEHAGSASGLLQTVQQLGAAVGVAIVASVYAVGAQPTSFVPGARAAYLTSATFAAIALVVALTTLARSRRGTAPAPEVEDELEPVPDLAA
jgi:EmrB/QacA subfamily drug resistance transporter